MAKTNDPARRAQWEKELSELRQMRDARRNGVEYVPEATQPAAEQPQVMVQAQPLFTQASPRVEISIEQLTAEVNGRVYKPEEISYERVSQRTRERTAEMGNRI